jgi:hypothetical protein
MIPDGDHEADDQSAKRKNFPKESFEIASQSEKEEHGNERQVNPVHPRPLTAARGPLRRPGDRDCLVPLFESHKAVSGK